MKRQNREVNIFNMSLLDILCGALGAFCFMMLALFPSYIKAQNNGGATGDAAKDAEDRVKQAEKERDKALDEQSLVYFNIRWNTADDIDMWIKGPGDALYRPEKDLGSAKKPPSFIHDTPKGPGGESAWFANVEDRNGLWEISAELHSRASGAATPGQSAPVPAPVVVRGYAVARSHNKDGGNIMGFYELGSVSLTKPGERLPLGRLVFDAAGRDFSVDTVSDLAAPPPAAPPPAAPPRQP